MRLSRAVVGVCPAPIPRAQRWGALFNATPDRPLLDLSQGAPGAPPPKTVLEAIAKAATDNLTTKYVPNFGIPALRQALADEMKVVYGKDTDVKFEDVALTAGCNMASAATIMALAENGDEVILPVPWYFNHQMTLQMLGIKVVPLPLHASEGFQPTVGECEALITPRTRAIILVNPNNPTGAVYPPELLSSFGQLAAKHDIALVVDETYRDFVLDGAPHTLFNPSPEWEWRKHLVHLYSFSKSYAIPGYRLGAVIGSPHVLEQVQTVLDCYQICPPHAVQVALAPLLPSLRSTFIQQTRDALEHRRELFKSILPPRWIVGSSGAYFSFVKHPFAIKADQLCENLAKEVGVVFLPATFFAPTDEERSEYDSWIRVAIANVDDDKIRMVSERLIEFEESHKDWVTKE